MAEGLTPLDYMLERLRNETLDPEARFEAAKAAAPYVHPRLSTIAADVDMKTTVERIERRIVRSPN